MPSLQTGQCFAGVVLVQATCVRGTGTVLSDLKGINHHADRSVEGGGE